MCRVLGLYTPDGSGGWIASLKKPTFKRLYKVRAFTCTPSPSSTVFSEAGLGGASWWKQFISN